ncbi:hypothetical protein BH11PLA2_BH11PLA2_51420 [soil metagenome]
MNRSRLLAAGSNWFAFAATLAVAFVLTPVLVRALGPSRYDVWCVAEAVLAYFTLLDMGLAACVVRAVARHHARNEHESLNKIASAGMLLFSLAGVAAIVIGVPVMLALAPRLDAKTEDVTAFLLLMLFNVAATLPLSLYPSLLDGLEKYTLKSIVRVGFLAARTLGIVLVIQHEATLFKLALVLTASNLLEHLTLAVFARRHLPKLQMRLSLVDRVTLREVRTYSVDAFLAMLAGRITVQTGTILIGVFLPGGQVTLFATAARLVEYAKTLLRTVTATLTPGVSALEAKNDWAGIRSLLLTVTKWLLYVTLPINLGLWYFGGAFLTRWVPEVGEAGALPLAILATTLTLGVAQSVASRLLYGLGKLKLFARLALAEAALNITMLLAFINLYGVVGVAIAVAVPNVLFCLAVIRHTLRVVDLDMRSYLKVWLKPLLAATLLALVWTLLPTAKPQWDSIAMTIAAGLIPYGVMVLVAEYRLPKSAERLRKSAPRFYPAPTATRTVSSSNRP